MGGDAPLYFAALPPGRIGTLFFFSFLVYTKEKRGVLANGFSGGGEAIAVMGRISLPALPLSADRRRGVNHDQDGVA